MSTAHVLVVDDEEDIRDVLKIILERAGFEVDVAASADDGIGMMRDKKADVVVTDIIMPGKDGVDAVYDIRMEFPKTKIIVISGGGNVKPDSYEPGAIKTMAYLASASAAGADVTLTKPFERDELISAVKGLVETSA